MHDEELFRTGSRRRANRIQHNHIRVDDVKYVRKLATDHSVLQVFQPANGVIFLLWDWSSR